QSPDAGGLFTWQRIRPVEFTGMPAARLHADDAFLIVASAISAPEWDALFSGLRQIMLITAAGLVVLTLLSAWLLRGRLQAMRTLRVMNEQLELRVRERTEELSRSYERDIATQKLAETRLQAQLQRLHLLEHITRAIGERQDLESILQVV